MERNPVPFACKFVVWTPCYLALITDRNKLNTLLFIDGSKNKTEIGSLPFFLSGGIHYELLF